MDTKSRSNDNLINDEIDTRIKTEINSQINPNNIEETVIRKKKSSKMGQKNGLLIILLALFLISATFQFYCEIKNTTNYQNENDEGIFRNGRIYDEAIRYAKNLNRYYIYFKNFNPDKAYDKIKSMETNLSERYPDSFVPYRAPDPSQYDESYSDYEENIKYGNIQNEEMYGNSDAALYNSNGVVEEDSVSIKLAPPENLYSDVSTYVNVSPSSEETSMQQSAVSSSTKDVPMEEDYLYKQYIELKETLANYEEVKNYLDRTDYFCYKIEDSNGNIYSNIKSENNNFLDSISLDDDMFSEIVFNGEYLKTSFIRNKLSGAIIIPENPGGFIGELIENTNQTKAVLKILKLVTPILFVVSIFTMVYSILKYKSDIEYYNQKTTKLFLKIPAAIKIFLLFGGLAFLISQWYSNYPIIYDITRHNYIGIIFIIILTACVFVYLITFVQYLFKIARNPKLLKDEPEINLLLNSLKGAKYTLKSENYFLFIFFMFLYICEIIITLFLLFCMFMFLDSGQIEVLFIGFATLIVFFIVSYGISIIMNFSKLICYINDMSNGKLNVMPESKGILKKPANDLNNISAGIKLSMEKAIKNERLKTELITNVSHDLKTPLTSIISYVDLLKEMGLNDLKAIEYIDVIDKKSQRLKFLIEDLFEASKLSTGHAELEKSSIDIVELLKQTMGELSNKINDSNIDFRFSCSNDHIYINIDGKKMWRVFENLLNNIIKYSLENSRAYINVSDNAEIVIITLKNTSAYEMSFDPNELFERFKRGDDSRSTEGSGLGLSIAKSIIELHGGIMNIETDGDLFKVTITLKK